LSKIICATKAAQNSRLVHEAAFRLADELGLELEFLHVIAVPNYEDLMEPLQDAVRAELHWLVHSLTRISRQRVGLSGISPSVEVVSGNISEAILRRVEDGDVEVLIMGTPDAEGSQFASSLESFLLEVNQTNTRVELVPDPTPHKN